MRNAGRSWFNSCRVQIKPDAPKTIVVQLWCSMLLCSREALLSSSLLHPCQILHLSSTYSRSMTICLSVCHLSVCLPACGLLRSCRGQSCWRYTPGKMQWRASVAFISLENAPRCLSLPRSLPGPWHVHILHSTQNLIRHSRFLLFLLPLRALGNRLPAPQCAASPS